MRNSHYYGSNYASSQEGNLFAAKEAYRTIRTNLMFSLAKAECKVIIFTSSIQGEGKTTTSANVAFSIAKSNKRVLLIDVDLRSPRIHRKLKKPCSPGLTNVLSGFNTVEEVLHKDVHPGLDVICAGTLSPNPSEMVASESLAGLISEFKKVYDYIILDTPPVNPVSDALSLIPLSDGVVMVIRPKYTDRKEVHRAIGQIEFVGGKILGAVANGVQRGKHLYGKKYGGRYGYGYGNGYGQRVQEAQTEEEKKESEE